MAETSQNDRMILRKKRVQEFCSRMESEGYTQTDLIVPAETANSRSILVTLPFIAVYAVLFGVIAGWKAYANLDFGLWSISIFVSILVHELIHGLFFGLFAVNKFRAIEFGVFWKTLNPYCFCNDPVSKRQYLIALTMPGILLGGVVGAGAIVAGSATWLLFSLIQFLMAGGDFMVALKIMQFGEQGNKGVFMDHPDQPGVLVFTKDTV